MLASLFGALVGGFFALVGGWLGLHWQAQHEARRVAGALLAELTVAQNLLERSGVATFYQQMLNDWKETGQIQDRQAIIDMFDNAPQDTLPVYYSMVDKLGLLPTDLAAEIVQYHATVIALPRMIVRFLGKRELDRSAVKEIAKAIEVQFHESTQLRAKLITELSAFETKPIGLLPQREPVDLAKP
jgi:hypothetical protein